MKKIILNLFIPIAIAFLNIMLIFYPTEVFNAARGAVSLWLNNIFPTLLPFLIGTNILMDLGFVNFLGTVLEPIMYPLFGIPGIGGFALVCGMTSGYPLGVKITSELREKKLITQTEAQRLISFTNNCGPLFIIATVGVAMFKSSTVGYFILLCHYISSIMTGLIFRNYKKENSIRSRNKKKILYHAYQNMMATKKDTNSNIPAIVSKGVKSAMETILIIGGYIILFSVITELFKIIFYSIGMVLPNFANLARMDESMLRGVFYGIIEITNGTKALSETGINQLSILSTLFVISFGGFCIHMQSINFISKTDINVFLYLGAKLMGSVIAVLIGIFLYPFFNFQTYETTMVFNNFENSFFKRLIFSSWCFICIIFICLLLFFVLRLISFLHKAHFRKHY